MNKIIAAVRNEEDFEAAIASSVETVFLLASDIFTLKNKIEEAHRCGKKIFVYFDFINGLGKDKFGIKYIKSIAPDGIISVKPNIIKQAVEMGIVSIQRFFVVDSKAIDTAFEMIDSVKPNMIEVMPGVAFKAVGDFAGRLSIPVIAGGLVSTVEEVEAAIAHGAEAISTGKRELWK